MLTDKRRLYLYTGAICFAALCTCMASNLVGPLLGDIMRHYHISLDRGGMMSLFQNVGGTLSIVLLSVVMDKLDRPLWLIAPLALLPACLLLIGAMPSFAVFMLLYMLFGVCLSMTDMLSNAIVPDIYQQKRNAALSLLHSFAPLGALVVPPVTGAILEAGIPWPRVYVLTGILCVVLLLVYILCYRLMKASLSVKPAAAAKDSTKQRAVLARMLKDRRILFASGCMFCFCAFQSGLTVWGTQYCKDVFGVGAVAAGFAVTLYWVATGLTRMLFSFSKFSALATRPVLLYGNLAAAVALAIGVASGQYTALLVCIFLAGCLNAPVIPRAVGLITGWYSAHSGLASSVALTALYIAFATAPLLMGAIAQHMGMRVILYLPAAFTALAGLFAILLPKEQV